MVRLPGLTAEEGEAILPLNWQQPRLVPWFKEQISSYWSKPFRERRFPSWRPRDQGWSLGGWRGRKDWRLRPVCAGFIDGDQTRYQHLLAERHAASRADLQRGFVEIGGDRYPVEGGPEIMPVSCKCLVFNTFD